MPENSRSNRRFDLSHRPLLGSTLSVAAVTAFARLNGGVREVLIAKEFGTSSALEAFLVGFGIITLIVVSIANAVPGALVPTYFSGGSAGRDRSNELLRSVLPRLTVALIVCAAICALGSPILALAGGGGFGSETRRQLQTVIVILAPVIVINGLSTFCLSLLNAREQFLKAAFPQVVNPVVTIIIVAWAPSPSSVTLALAFLSGFVMELMLAIGVSLLDGLRLQMRITSQSMSDRALFFSLLIPMSVAGALQASTTVVDQSVASHLPQGQVAILAFGQRITGFISAVAIAAVGTVVLPQFSRMVAERDISGLRQSMKAKVIMVAIAGCLFAVVTSVFSRPIIDAVFGRGEFSQSDVSNAANVQLIAAWQVPIQLISVLYLRLLSARHMRREILLVSLGAVAVNIVLDLLFAFWLGVSGIALSTTAVMGGSCLAYRTLARMNLKNWELDCQKRAHL